MADPNFFKNHGPYPLKKLAEIGQAKLNSEQFSDAEISDVAPIEDAQKGQVTFLSNVKYRDKLAYTKATACILNEAVAKTSDRDDLALLISENPYKSYALIAQAFYPLREKSEETTIHSSAVVADSAHIGKGVSIGANTVVGENVEIGNNTMIDANVTISHAKIGENCRIFPGVRIGQDGFGFAMDPAGHVTVPQLGRVIIGNAVEIGANTTIDRGAGPDTIIGDGTRIDNLVQIGHNAKIGKNCVIVGQAGVSGSTELKDYAVLAAQAGVAGHLTIGVGAQIGAKAGLNRNVPDGAKVMGYPAKNMRDFWKEQAILKKLVIERDSKLGKEKGKDDGE